MAFNISEHFIFFVIQTYPMRDHASILVTTTYGWYDGGYLLGDGHRGDALADGTTGRQEGAHVSSDCWRLEEAELTEASHLHLYLSTTDQLT